MNRLVWLSRSRAYLTIGCLVVFVVRAVLDQEWIALAAGTALVVWAARYPVGAVVGLLAAWYLDAPWLAVTCAVILAHAAVVRLLPMRLLRPRADPGVLQDAVLRIGAGTLEALDSFRAGEPVGPVHLVMAAGAEDPREWGELSISEAGDDWNGTLLTVGDRPWMTLAAEAAALARILGRETDGVSGAQLLGAAAVLIPESPVSRAGNTHDLAGRVTGLGPEHLVELLQEFVKSPAGADALRRAELRMQLDPNRQVDDRILFSGDRRVTLLALVLAVSGPVAVVAVLGEMAASAFTAPVRWWRAARRPRDVPPNGPAADAPATRIRPARWRRIRATLRDAPAAIRVGRPLCTTAAIVLVAAGPLPWWVKLIIGVLLVLLRPLRRWWLDVLWVAGLGALAVHGGVLLTAATAVLAARMIITWLAVRRRGFEAALTEPRRRLPGIWSMHPEERIPTPEQAWASFAEAVRRGEDDPFDGSAEYVLAAWATGDAVVQGRAVTRALRKELLGQYPADLQRPPSLIAHVGRLYFLETLAGAGVRWLAAVAAATVTALALPVPAIIWGPVRVPGWLFTAVTVLLLVVQLADRVPSWFGVLVTVLPILVLSRAAAIPALTVSVLAAVAAWTVRRYVERRVLVAPPRIATASLTMTGFRFRLRYRAAAGFVARNRPGIAVDLLTELAENSAGRRPGLAAVALAETALVELERGRLQPAVDRAAAAAALAATARATSFARFAQGVIWSRVGDHERAIPELRAAEPVLRGTAEGVTCAAALAQSLAVTGNVAEANTYLARAAARPNLGGHLMVLVEAQLAVGRELLREQRYGEAYATLEDIGPGFGGTEDDEAGSERATALWLRLVGEVSLVKGRAALADGRLPEAGEQLRIAVQHLRRTTATDLLGTARIAEGEYHGTQRAWKQACESVRAGIRLLEHRRGQLRLGAHRGGLLSVDRAVYDSALGVLVRAQRAGRGEAGEIAAALLESLRRDSFASLLRDGRGAFADRLPESARDLVARIAVLESGFDLEGRSADEREESVRKLREELGDAVSRGFAEAYLPEDVDLARMLPALRGAHVLQFEFVEVGAERWRGYRTWIPPGGRPVVDEVIISGPGALEILADSTPENAGAFSIPLLHVAGDWADLAGAILPAGLLLELALLDPRAPARLVVCAGEHLAYLPWPALLLDAEDPEAVLVRKAVLQFVPSLSVVGESEPAVPGGDVLAYLDRDTYDDPEQRRRLTGALSVVFAESRSAFEEHLAGRRFTGGYLTAHGTGSGIAQGVRFSDGGVLSAAVALRYRWPHWLVFASCFVAKLEQQAGHEPFGLVGACMLGGCRSVIGGVIAVEQSATTAITTEVAIAVAGGADPAAALRTAQLARLDALGDAAFIDQWAGLICFATTAHSFR
ncbi:CHAT domain-containing protein [Actinoplanes couchii]|uniref:CHAT domain-containing protein n=1 Tax=Actinoplanes couchii TaxID=403638 RepID=A0ABQ3X814_9ACTN|nr:CHAT domain-containing protein [Actinoplanes couchii]MDR6320332.1 tetratricopeptide (TPR) repeat protein [Actinoplanes couchii]GID54654.1 hypothetical protein Aco03nite_030580 [Actinoplanes couchii]